MFCIIEKEFLEERKEEVEEEEEEEEEEEKRSVSHFATAYPKWSGEK